MDVLCAICEVRVDGDAVSCTACASTTHPGCWSGAPGCPRCLSAKAPQKLTSAFRVRELWPLALAVLVCVALRMTTVGAPRRPTPIQLPSAPAPARSVPPVVAVEPPRPPLPSPSASAGPPTKPEPRRMRSWPEDQGPGWVRVYFGKYVGGSGSYGLPLEADLGPGTYRRAVVEFHLDRTWDTTRSVPVRVEASQATLPDAWWRLPDLSIQLAASARWYPTQSDRPFDRLRITVPRLFAIGREPEPSDPTGEHGGLCVGSVMAVARRPGPDEVEDLMLPLTLVRLDGESAELVGPRNLKLAVPRGLLPQVPSPHRMVLGCPGTAGSVTIGRAGHYTSCGLPGRGRSIQGPGASHGGGGVCTPSADARVQSWLGGAAVCELLWSWTPVPLIDHVELPSGGEVRRDADGYVETMEAVARESRWSADRGVMTLGDLQRWFRDPPWSGVVERLRRRMPATRVPSVGDVFVLYRSPDACRMTELVEFDEERAPDGGVLLRSARDTRATLHLPAGLLPGRPCGEGYHHPVLFARKSGPAMVD